MSEALFAMAAATITRTFRSAVEVRPQIDEPQMPKEADPARAIVACDMVFSEAPALIDMANNGLGRNAIGVQSTFAGTKVTAHVDPGLLPYTPQKGDHVVRQRDEKLFRIGEIATDGHGGWYLHLNGS